jgi:hypothetical protein
MVGIVILNVVFSAGLIVGILALLGWGIWSDSRTAFAHGRRRIRQVHLHRHSRPRGTPSRASQLTA